MILAVPKGHLWCGRKSIQLKDLRTEKFISRERGSGTLESLRQLLSKGRQSVDELLNISMELGSTEAIKQAIVAGCGISILSRISIRRELADGRLVEVSIRGIAMERDFYQVYHARRTLHPNAQAFREFLKQA
jgi:DNA-binding transcriptional LysR family regulator